MITPIILFMYAFTNVTARYQFNNKIVVLNLIFIAWYFDYIS